MPGNPDFRSITTDHGEGVTYTCGCPCTPAAVPTAEGPGFEHCCCGKVHFAGPRAAAALDGYLSERKPNRKREPDYERGSATVELGGRATEVAWAFPIRGAV
jgi:hypothetical protein